MFLSRAGGFAKQAAAIPGEPLYKSLGRNVFKGLRYLSQRPGARKMTLGLAAGAAGGAYLHQQLQSQPPMESGALQRSKRRTEIETFGSV
jgi:hypothetical protein